MISNTYKLGQETIAVSASILIVLLILHSFPVIVSSLLDRSAHINTTTFSESKLPKEVVNDSTVSR